MKVTAAALTVEERVARLEQAFNFAEAILVVPAVGTEGGTGAGDDYPQYTKLAGRTGTTNDTTLSTSTDGTLYGSTTTAKYLVLRANSADTSSAGVKLDAKTFFWPSAPTTTHTVSTYSPTLAVSGITLVGHEVAPTLTWTTPGGYFGFKFGGTQTVAVQPTNINFHAALYATLTSNSSTNAVIPWAPDLLVNAMSQTFSGGTASAPTNYISTDISSIPSINVTNTSTLNYNASGSGFCSILWAGSVTADAGSTINMGRMTAVWDKSPGASGAGTKTIAGLSTVFTEDRSAFGGTVACVESQITSGANKWFLYGTGSAASALGGGLRIGDTTAPSAKLELAGPGTYSGAVVAQSIDLTGTANASGSVTTALDVLGTVTRTTGPGFVFPQLVKFRPTLKQTAGTTFDAWTGFYVGPTCTADGVGITSATETWFTVKPTYDIANAGTFGTAITNVNYQSELVLNNAGVTVTTHTHYKVVDASGAGALTTQLGFDLPALAKGTNNYGVRSAVAAGANNQFLRGTGTASSVHAGALRLGDSTVPNVCLDTLDLALRRLDFAASNGANNDVSLGTYPGGTNTPTSKSFVRVTGGGASCTITGFDSNSGAVDGKLLFVFNNTGANLTLKQAVTSAAANQLNLKTGADTVLASLATAIFLYSTNASKWIQVV